jgi:hypothetical protein
MFMWRVCWSVVGEIIFGAPGVEKHKKTNHNTPAPPQQKKKQK